MTTRPPVAGFVIMLPLESLLPSVATQRLVPDAVACIPSGTHGKSDSSAYHALADGDCDTLNKAPERRVELSQYVSWRIARHSRIVFSSRRLPWKSVQFVSATTGLEV